MGPAAVPKQNGDRGQSALTQLRAFLAQQALPPATRLPPERELCDLLGVSRGELRKALARPGTAGRALAPCRQGHLHRRAPGRRTLVGRRDRRRRPIRARSCARGSPIEPELAREAALHATADDIAEMQLCLAGVARRRDLAAIRELGQPAAPGDRRGRAQRASARAVRHAECGAPHRGVGPAARRRTRIRRPIITASPSMRRSSRRSRSAIFGGGGAMRQHLENVQALLLTRGAARPRRSGNYS